MVRVKTINAETGDFVEFNYKTGEQDVIYEASEILCYGYLCDDHAEVLLKKDFPYLENLKKPKILYRSFESDHDVIVINVETGPSIVICDGKIVSQEYEVLHVISLAGGDCLLITNELVIFMGSRIGKIWTHDIPDLKNSVMTSIDWNGPMMSVYSEGKCTTCEFVGIHSGLNDGDMGPITCCSKDNRLVADFGNLLIFDIECDSWTLVDTKMGEAHTCTGHPTLLVTAKNCSGFALNEFALKFYQGENSVVIWENDCLNWFFDKDKYLPLPKVTNTKSARSG